MLNKPQSERPWPPSEAVLWDLASLKSLGHRFEQIWKADPEPCQPKLLLQQTGRYFIYYSPIWLSQPSPEARLILVGLTPGRSQAKVAGEIYAGASEELRRDRLGLSRMLRQNAAFRGSMRQNLCHMLDQLGLPGLLKVNETHSLFEDPTDPRLAATSALPLPVFQGPNQANFSGIRDLASQPVFCWMLRHMLLPVLESAPKAVVIPLGRSAESGLRYLASQQSVSPDRILWNFPHPSGANGHRLKQFEQQKESLRNSLQRCLAR